MIAPRPSATADCFITLLLERVLQLVRVGILPIRTTLPVLNVPPPASSASASPPFARAAFPQPQPLNTTITALATVHALLEPSQTGSTVLSAIAPLSSALPAALLHPTAPPAPLATFRSLYLAPALPLARPQAPIQSVTRSTKFAFPPVLITWCWSTWEAASIHASTAPIALTSSPPLHLASHPVPIITMRTAPSGSAHSAMPAASPATAGMLKTAPPARLLPLSAIFC